MDNCGQCIAVDAWGYTHVSWSGYDGESRIYYATDAPASYSITASSNPTAGGSVTGTGIYRQDSTVDLRAVANTGYHFVNWIEGGGEVCTDPDYSFTATANRTLVANFEMDTHTVTVAVSGGHGTASPATQTVNLGGNATVNIKPDKGYKTVSVTDNGSPVTPVPTTSYAINNVSTDHVVEVTFAPDKPPPPRPPPGTWPREPTPGAFPPTSQSRTRTAAPAMRSSPTWTRTHRLPARGY